MENSENEQKKNKKSKKTNIVVGIIIGLLLASTLTMSALYATKKTCNDESTYSVFYSADGSTVYTESVKEGNNVANVPTVPNKAGYSGTWSEDGTNITKDIVIYAVYTAENYTLSINASKVDCLTTAPLNMTNVDVVPLVFAPESSLYALPETVTVTGANYTWDKATGLLTLSGANADVVVEVNGINAPQELAIHYLIYPGAKSYVQVNSDDRIYFPSPEVDPVISTVYSEAIPGDTVAMYAEIQCGMVVKKINVLTGEESEVYSSGWENVQNYSFTTEFGYKYYLEFGFQTV